MQEGVALQTNMRQAPTPEAPIQHSSRASGQTQHHSNTHKLRRGGRTSCVTQEPLIQSNTRTVKHKHHIFSRTAHTFEIKLGAAAVDWTARQTMSQGGG